MSHDRGCFVCFEDRPYDNCKRHDCPHKKQPAAAEESVKQTPLLVFDDIVDALMDNIINEPSTDTSDRLYVALAEVRVRIRRHRGL
jgi:hypothetical protein